MPKVVTCLIPSSEPRQEPLGDPLLDAYLEFLSGRCRPHSVLAARFDLKVFFTVVAKPVQAVTATDLLGFITAQRSGAVHLSDPLLAPVEDGTVGVSLRNVRRRLSTITGLYAFLTARGDVPMSPVPRGLPTRRDRHRPTQGVPLVRSPRRTLPRILTPVEVDALTAALRTHRDRAMVTAMLLGGLRRCEVLGLRLDDVRTAERRLFIANGKGGPQRFVPISSRFFEHLAAYLEQERLADADTDVVFLVLKQSLPGEPSR
ncbi:tyrosine-type recombinase/integrase [Terracoccus luteus]|uniref:Site-specific recombinase XerD n=1 Tax=Terracoccus luteus TaxID=53356 RepID=A0A839PW86_9MICO|nr:tyrosine-type recombinase/integrase [Terracoccus luteus]MBB2988508.1 site-specific recombinase XerD [Terracoccus luteus]MCP2174145.1 site-specific recombinase XerD [Terracoccus luteus]